MNRVWRGGSFVEAGPEWHRWEGRSQLQLSSLVSFQLQVMLHVWHSQSVPVFAQDRLSSGIRGQTV